MFADPEEHEKNPPHTWIVTHGADQGTDVYRLTTADGATVLGRFGLEKVAEEHREHGYLVTAYEREGRWFAGETEKGGTPWTEIEAEHAKDAAEGREEFDPVDAEARRVVRHFQRYTPEQRANRAASHRLTAGQRNAVGEHFYTHPDVPGVSFDTRRKAARAAVAAATKRRRRVEMFAAKFAADTICMEPPRYVEPTDAALTEAFANCLVPPGKLEPLYDEIRTEFARIAADIQELHYGAAIARQAALLTRPDVAAVVLRVQELTPEEVRHLDAAWRQSFRLYRAAQSDLWHRARRAYGAHWRDVLSVADDAAGQIDPAYPGVNHAAADYVKALLLGNLLAEHERVIFAGPWLAVIGDGGPRAELPARAEEYVSPWAMV